MNRIEGVPINVLSNKSHKFIKIDNGRSSRSLQMTLSSRHIIILLASRCTLLDNALPVLLILKSYGNWATIDNVLNYLFSMLTCLRRIKASYLYSNVKSKECYCQIRLEQLYTFLFNCPKLWVLSFNLVKAVDDYKWQFVLNI